MRVLITGICGFVGAAVAKALVVDGTVTELIGVDNFSRRGSEMNRPALEKLGVRVVVGDIRCPSDVDSLPAADWVIDAAANPSVLAGIAGSSSRQLVEHNLLGTINVLEYCKSRVAGLIMLSTSRVYSIAALASLPLESANDRFRLRDDAELPAGIGAAGVSEGFSTLPPISLYGSTKLASEQLALEYSAAYQFPVWVNRCGVMAGAGQFGKADQGIFSFWIHSWREGRPLRYIGFEGRGHQVRDCLHPRDLVPLLRSQMNSDCESGKPHIVNVSGGTASARSLRQLSAWCTERWSEREVATEPATRPFDVPWLVLDHRRATEVWGWRAATAVDSIFEEIAAFAEEHPQWIATTV